MLATLALYSDRLFMAAVGGLRAVDAAARRRVRGRPGGRGRCWSAPADPGGDHRRAGPGRAASRRRPARPDGGRAAGARGRPAAGLDRRPAGWPPAAGRWATCTSSPARSAWPRWSAWLLVLRRWPAARPAGLFLLLPVVVLLFLAGTVLYAQAAPVMPALQSYWLVVHVTTIALGLRAVLRARRGQPALPAAPLGPAVRARRPAAGRGEPGPAGLPHHDHRVPALHVRGDRRCDLGRGRVGTVLGLGPEGDRGLRRLGDLRGLPARPGDRGLAHRPRGVDQRRPGFAAIIFNLFFINMVVAGLHSYAGLG